MATYSLAGDYASVGGEHADFYYGYEVTNPDNEDEWCFQADIHGTRIVVPYSKLANNPRSQFECGECLLAGIAMILDKFKFTQLTD
jgi:hypothetical protein